MAHPSILAARKPWISSVPQHFALFLRRSAAKLWDLKTVVPAILLLCALLCFACWVFLLLLSYLLAGMNGDVNAVLHLLLPSLQFTNGGLGLLVGFSVLTDAHFGRVKEEYLYRWNIWRLPRVKYGSLLEEGEENREKCCICLERIGCEEIVRILPKCEHYLHGGCIDQWLLSHSSCPLCRAPVCR